MLKKAMVQVLLIVLAGFAGACDQEDAPPDGMMSGRMEPGEMTSVGMMDNMMRAMREDPEMMDAMMADTLMMRQMMDDPRMIETMTQYMAEHLDVMGAHMERMMSEAEHRRAMTEVLREHPAMREQMRAILDAAEGGE